MMAAYCKQMSSSVLRRVPPPLRSATSFLPPLYGGSHRKQSTSVELIHGSSECRPVRPATAEERSYEAFHRNYARQGLFYGLFNSRKAVSEEIWRKSVRHATNKMEVLRLCLHERGGGGEDLWLYELKNHDIDLKIIESNSVLEVVEELQNEGLDHSFWSVRIFPADRGEEHPIPELKQEFPYQYKFFFKFHHGLWDGTSTAYFVRKITEILNDIISGKTVNDDKIIGKFIYDDPLKAKTKEIQQALENDPLNLDKEKERMIRVTTKQPILYTAFPKPKSIKRTTRHIVRKVDNAKMNTLYKCCKLKNVNMTAAFEAVFSTALVEMVRDAGIIKDEYKINIRQNINMRRYMEIENDFEQFPMGPFLGGMQQETYCTKEVRKHFWEHAQVIHRDFHFLLKNNGPIIESIVRPQIQGRLDPQVLANNPTQDNSDFAFSNMLDVTPLLFYEGNEIQLTDGIAFNFIHNFLHPMLFQYSTYRGIGTLTCSYDTAKLTDNTAHELMERVMNVLDFVTK